MGELRPNSTGGEKLTGDPAICLDITRKDGSNHRRIYRRCAKQDIPDDADDCTHDVAEGASFFWKNMMDGQNDFIYRNCDQEWKIGSNKKQPNLVYKVRQAHWTNRQGVVQTVNLSVTDFTDALLQGSSKRSWAVRLIVFSAQKTFVDRDHKNLLSDWR